MAHATGNGSWNHLGKPALTPEMVQAKAKEIATQFKDLFIAYGLAVNILADAGDALGLQALSTATKMMLADGADRCADAIDRITITE